MAVRDGELILPPLKQTVYTFRDNDRHDIQTLHRRPGLLASAGLTHAADADLQQSQDNVVKCTIMIADMGKWADFNKVYVTYFKPGRLPRAQRIRRQRPRARRRD
jgi:hypothetical protein